MLPKKVYGKVLQSLRKIEANWRQDRIDNPSSTPYEIDTELSNCIKRHMREAHLRFSGEEVEESIKYLVANGTLIGSPYGGVMFPHNEKMPSKEKLKEQILKQMGGE